MTSIRRYDLDWLRVLAFLILIVFHAGMAFVEFPWHIKNAETSRLLTILWGFIHGWRMPLLFLISGAGIWFALGKRGVADFVAERCRRLLIPLAFGVLVIVPPQVYLERLTQGAVYTSYLDFYPHFFEGFYFSAGGGNFSPHHLWFIGSLFIYCLALTPLLVYLKSKSGAYWLDRFDRLASNGWILYALTILLLLAFLIWPGGFFLNSVTPLLMLLGFLLMSSQRVWPVLERLRYVSLGLALSLSAVALSVYFLPGGETRIFWFDLIRIPAALTMLYAILGLARRHLSFNSRVLAYLNEGVYPFYILHQTFTVVIVYWLTPLGWNLWIQFAMTVVGTMVTTGLTYHYLIRPVGLLRPLFGLRNKAARAD